MKVMIDTHVWVFYVASMNDQLSRSALSTLKKAGVLCVSAISCWEIALLVKKGRLGNRQRFAMDPGCLAVSSGSIAKPYPGNSRSLCFVEESAPGSC